MEQYFITTIRVDAITAACHPEERRISDRGLMFRILIRILINALRNRLPNVQKCDATKAQ